MEYGVSTISTNVIKESTVDVTFSAERSKELVSPSVVTYNTTKVSGNRKSWKRINKSGVCVG